MLTVHHLNNSRSQRVVWLCEELGIEYELVKHQRNAETQRSPDSLNAVHPLGKAPTIVHDGRTIVESEAILEYICQTCAGGRLSRSPGAPDYGDYLQWLAFAEGSLLPGLAVDMVYAWTGGGNDTFKGFFDVEIEHNLGYSESCLGGRDHLLASGFSAATSISAGRSNSPNAAAACVDVPACRPISRVCAHAPAIARASNAAVRRT